MNPYRNKSTSVFSVAYLALILPAILWVIQKPNIEVYFTSTVVFIYIFQSNSIQKLQSRLQVFSDIKRLHINTLLLGLLVGIQIVNHFELGLKESSYITLCLILLTTQYIYHSYIKNKLNEFTQWNR